MGRQVIPDDTSMIVVSLRYGVLLDVSQHCVDEIPKNKLVAIHLRNMNPPTRTLNGTIDIRRKEGVARFDAKDHVDLGFAPCVVSWVAYLGCHVSLSIFCIYRFKIKTRLIHVNQPKSLHIQNTKRGRLVPKPYVLPNR